MHVTHMRESRSGKEIAEEETRPRKPEALKWMARGEKRPRSRKSLARNKDERDGERERTGMTEKTNIINTMHHIPATS